MCVYTECVCVGILCFSTPIDEMADEAVAPAAHWQENSVKMLKANDNHEYDFLEMFMSCLMFLHTSQPHEIKPPCVIHMQYTSG